jgi:hypothetical protein
MPLAPKKTEVRLNETLNAWQTLRPNKAFGGMTLDQFKARLKPSFDSRATIAALDNQLLAAQNQRDDADADSLAAINLVVNSVKGDPQEGEDGEFYEALGYVRKSERKSGLRRGKVRPAVAAA